MNSRVPKSLIRCIGESGCSDRCLTSAECCTLFSLRALLTGSQSSDVNLPPSFPLYTVCRAYATYRTEERSNATVWWAEKSEKGKRGKRERGRTRTNVRELHVHGEKSVTVFVKTRNSGTSLLISDDPSPFATRCELHSFSTYPTPLNPHHFKGLLVEQRLPTTC